jgi:hypothetical protein
MGNKPPYWRDFHFINHHRAPSWDDRFRLFLMSRNKLPQLSFQSGEREMHGAEIERSLYRQHARAFDGRTARTILGNPSWARDAVHDAFERMLRHLAVPAFERRPPPPPYGSLSVPHVHQHLPGYAAPIKRVRAPGRGRRSGPAPARATRAIPRIPSGDYARHCCSNRVGTTRTATVGVHALRATA